MDNGQHLDRPPQFRTQLAGQIPQQAAVQAVPSSPQPLEPVNSGQGIVPPNSGPGKRPVLPKNVKKYLKYLGLVVGFIVALLILFLAATVTSVDTLLVKASLSGQITTIDGGVIPGASVRIMGNNSAGEEIEYSATTDINGYYYLGNLELGGYELIVEAEGFESFEQQIPINRSFLDYNTNLDISLQPSGEGFIVGKFIVEDVASYNFIDDTLTVNGQTYQVQSDGSFTIPDLTTGQNSFRFSSTDYTDVIRTIDLEPGENNLEEIKLIPSGDIVGSLKSYIREDIVGALQITVEGLPQDQVEVDADAGSFRIRDLEIGREYRISISHPNYVNREYLQAAEKGEASLFGLRIVEDGAVVYLKEDPRDIEVFASEYDGAEEKQLTDNDFEPYAEFLDSDDTIYFLSTRDSVTSTLGRGRALLVYAVPVAGGNAQRVTNNIDELGLIYPNFKAKKLVQITTTSEKGTNRVLQSMDLTGANRKLLFGTNEGEINDLVISDDGNFVAFSLLSGDDANDGLYRVDLTTGESTRVSEKQPVQIFDITENGNGILYSYFNTNTDLNDLYYFTANTGQDKKIRSSFTGKQYQFVKNNEDNLVYFDIEEERSNLYTLNISSNKIERLTSFSGTEGVEAVYQQNGFIIYQTNRGLYIMDFEKPHPGKLVTTDFARYTGIDY